MTKKHFEAILAKNMIACEIRDSRFGGSGEILINANVIIECLKDIEDYIGEGNQPCVSDIVEDLDSQL